VANYCSLRQMLFPSGHNSELDAVRGRVTPDGWANELRLMAVNQKIGHEDLHDPYEESWTPLHVAMDCSASDVAEALIDAGADIEAVDEEHNTPLYLAVRKDFLPGVSMLLEKGANPNCRNYQSYSPLMRAAERGNLEIAELLIDYGAEIGVFEPDGMSLLNICGEQSKNPALFAYLLGLGLDPYREDKAGYMPLHDMILNGDFMSYVMNWDFDFSRITDINKGLLSMVIELNRGGSHFIIRRLLKRLPVDKRKQFIDNYPPRFVGALCNAVHRDELRAIGALVEFGADLDAEGSVEGSALMVACMKGRLEAVKILVGLGAKIAYVVAERGGCGRPVKVVIRNAAAAAVKFPEIVRWLLVGRFAEVKSLSDEEPDLLREIWPWSGVVAAEVDLFGVGDQVGLVREESRIDFLTRMSDVRDSYRDRTVVPRGWLFRLADPSKWDVP
jgi:ankyrin repeat protein